MSDDDYGQPRSTDRQALLQRIARAQAARRGIAIVGVDCRIPGVAKWGDMRRLLRDGVDAIVEVPPTRWDSEAIYDRDFERRGTVTTRWGGFIEDIDRFDADFFGISPREAATMDPQHRLLLTTAWHAIEDAGLTRAHLAGSRTGVYLAQYQSDYARLALANPQQIDAYTASGTHHGIAANRLSYVLDLRGPSVVVDTACSSSLVAVHLAMRALRSREVDRAIVAGVNLMISPEETMALSRWGVMAADGRCKAFDARADGFVRGEGVAVLVLARTEQALSDGLRIRAELLGSAVNQDGRSNGLTAPNGLAQQQVLREALDDAKLEPRAVTMLEAHGTGTALGDPIEFEALAAVYGQGDRPCAVTSIKSHIGHLEAAAGVAGLLEAVSCIEHEEIAASLHVERVNPALAMDGTRLFIAREPVPWIGRRVAGVSAFGMGGTNAHVILAQPPEREPVVAEGTDPKLGSGPGGRGLWAGPDPKLGPTSGSSLLVISAHDDDALLELVRRWIVLLREDHVGSARALCAAAAQQRSAMRRRVAVVGSGTAELADQLELWLTSPDIGAGDPRRRGPVFLFPGQGSQWLGMGRELRRAEPIFEAALERCDEVIEALAGFSILAELERDDARLGAIEIVQPLLFALSVAYAALWRGVGVEPSAVVGHSMGEAAAAYVSGALSLEDAARIIVERSSRMARLRGRGSMLVVSASLEQVLTELASAQGQGQTLEVAAVNGPRSVVVSGPVAACSELSARLEARAIETRRIEVEVASHHAGMDALRDELLDSFAGLCPRASELPLHSTVDAALVDGASLDASYWFRNLREPVRLWPVIEGLARAGAREFVELSPHPILLPAISEGLELSAVATIPTTRRASELDHERSAWLAAVGRLWTRGHAIDWRVLQGPPPAVGELPRYPFTERRFWLATRRPQLEPSASVEPLPEDLDDWSYAMAWRELEAHPRGVWPGAAELPPTLVIGRGLLADALTLALRSAGCEVTRAREAEDARVGLARGGCARVVALMTGGPVCGDPCRPEPGPSRRDPVCGDPCRPEPGPSRRDPGQGASDRATLVEDASELALLLRALDAHAAKLWLVTQGGGPALADRSPLAAARWGLARVASVEHEHVCERLVDLDPNADAQACAQALVEELRCSEARETTIALRQGARSIDEPHAPGPDPSNDRSVGREAQAEHRRLGLRLVRAPLEPGDALSLRRDACYLVLGGLGGLGREVCRWLVERGARHLLTVTRAPLPARSEWAASEDPRVATIVELERAGASVHPRTCDIADREAFGSLLSLWSAEARPPIRGMVHAAGTQRRGALIELDVDELDVALAAKIDGSEACVELLGSLDFAVLCSSAASMLRSPLLAAYVSASAYQDALAEQQRAAGRAWTAIGWGVWAAGMTERFTRDTGRSVPGFSPMAPAAALISLERALAAGVAHRGIMRVDWKRWANHHDHEASTMLMDELVHGSESAVLSEGPTLDELAALDARERSQRVRAYVLGRVAKIIRTPIAALDAGRSPAALGLDSLMAVELRRRVATELGVTLSIVSILRSESLDELARTLDDGLSDHLADSLVGSEGEWEELTI